MNELELKQHLESKSKEELIALVIKLHECANSEHILHIENSIIDIIESPNK